MQKLCNTLGVQEGGPRMGEVGLEPGQQMFTTKLLLAKNMAILDRIHDF